MGSILPCSLHGLFLATLRLVMLSALARATLTFNNVPFLIGRLSAEYSEAPEGMAQVSEGDPRPESSGASSLRRRSMPHRATSRLPHAA